jgi:hypothetical protein
LTENNAPSIGGIGLNTLKPELTAEKYDKLQKLRVVVTISYTTGVGFTSMSKWYGKQLKKSGQM